MAKAVFALALKTTLAIFVFSGSAYWIFGAQQTIEQEEQKALRNEMVELDIRVRNIASMLSLADATGAYINFSKIAHMEEERSHSMVKGYASLTRKWKKQGLLTYRNNITIKAQEIIKILAGVYRTPEKVDWNMLQAGFYEIIEQCRQCHQQVNQTDQTLGEPR